MRRTDRRDVGLSLSLSLAVSLFRAFSRGDVFGRVSSDRSRARQVKRPRARGGKGKSGIPPETNDTLSRHGDPRTATYDPRDSTIHADDARRGMTMMLYRAAADCHMYQPKRSVRSASRDFGLLTSCPCGLVSFLLFLRPVRLARRLVPPVAFFSFFSPPPPRFPDLGKRSFSQKSLRILFFRNRVESRQQFHKNFERESALLRNPEAMRYYGIGNFILIKHVFVRSLAY